MRNLALIAGVLLSLYCAAYASRVAVARFNSRGITGYVRFTELENGSIRIEANLQGLRGAHDWHVHSYPVDQSLDPAVQCLGTQVGRIYNPFNVNQTAPDYIDNCQMNLSMCAVGDLETKFGDLMMDGQVDVIDTSGQLALTGRFSIVGRPLIIHEVNGPAHFECGTIRLMEEQNGTPVILLHATFISPIAGTIYLRQVGTENVEIFGKLYWVNDSDSTMMHNWHIHESQPGEEYRFAECDIMVGGNVGPHYDPTGNGPTSRDGYPMDCTPDTPSGCEVGDLTGKHAQLSIPARPDPYSNGAFFFTDTFLNLTDVIGRSIVVHTGPPALSCAPLVRTETITVTSSATRFIRASQSSPFEDTRIYPSGIVGDTVNPLPTANVAILSNAINPQATDCGMDEEIYSPYALVNDGGETTPDRYALGDWFNRYRDNLNGNGAFSVFDMPIYGANTISGRTMRAIDTDQQTRYCSFFSNKLEMNENILRARAVFSGSEFGPIEGAIYLSQRDFGDGVLGQTNIFVDIYYAQSGLDTTGHSWHVHQTPPVSGMNCTAAIGPHYNPFSVSLGNLNAAMDPSTYSDYSEDCSPTYPLRCESGDFSGKHGQLDITSEGENRRSFSYIDPNVHLTGSTTIIGRSIGLHNFTGPLFDCGEVTPIFAAPMPISVLFPAGEMLRSEFAGALTDGTEVNPVDVFVVNQQVIQQFGIECVNVTSAVLGTSPEQAMSNYQALANNVEQFRCGSAATIVMTPLLLAVCLLVAMFSK